MANWSSQKKHTKENKKTGNRRKLRTLERKVQWNGTPGGTDDK